MIDFVNKQVEIAPTGGIDIEDVDTWPVYSFDEVIFEQATGQRDKNGKMSFAGDVADFSGNMTADNSFGLEPNGYFFDEDDRYAIFWNDKLLLWDLDIPDDPDDEFQWKYKMHVRDLFINGKFQIIGNIHDQEVEG